jgi:REDY-like protein HapK
MRIVVLFNLKAGSDVAAYEEWARTRDLPGVRSRVSVTDFQVYRATGLLGGDARPAYQYVGIIDVDSLEGFERDLTSEAARKIATEFRDFADNPQFILTEALSDIA